MEQHEDKLYCPKCGSSQLVANKKGFGAGKALAGAIITGGVGLLAGFIGSGKVKITCLKCGSKWKPGELRTTPLEKKEDNELENLESASDGNKIDGCGMVVLVIIAVVFTLIYATLCS